VYYALAIICTMSGPCDVEHAIWAEESDPDYPTAEDCFIGAGQYLRERWETRFPHHIVLICTEATVEAKR
jgi:hypothetical protein